MKKQLYSLVGLFLFTAITLFAQPDNTALGDIQVASPQVASLAKFSEASNHHFTGAAGVSVPIEVLEEGNLRLPISVNYHASGIRSGEAASRCGMGWALSATGILSRTILGIEDEATNGYLNTNYDYSLNSVLNNVSSGLADGEPDLWSYSLPGGISGKFILNKSINEVVQYPRTDVKIEVSGDDLEEFTIITPDGTRYILGQAGNENYDGFIQVGDLPLAFAGSKRQHTEWYLRKIESYDQNYELNFSYKAKEYILLSPASEQYSKIFSNRSTNDGSFLQADAGFGMGGESVGAFQVLAQNNGRTTLPLFASIQQFETKELASITTSTTRVDFIEGNNKRQDLDASPYSESTITDNLARSAYQMYPLAQIRVSGIGGSPYCKTFNFNYDYFKAFASPLYSFDVRLKLNSIQEISCSTSDRVNPYSFAYYTDAGAGFDFLPWRLTKARDAYGYYNAEAANDNQKFSIPATTLSAANGGNEITLTHGSAKRQTEFSPMLYGTLKSVTYPERGKNEFVYEANSIKRVTKDTTEVNLSIPVATLQNCPIAPNVCCGTQTHNRTYNFTREFIDSAIIKIYLQNLGCMSEPGIPYEGFIRLSITDLVTNNQIGTLKTLNSTRLFDSLTLDMKANYPSMVAGRDYQFSIEVTEARGVVFFKKKQINETVDNELVGGLRLKEQHSFDRSNNLLTSRFYDYSLPNERGVSSGVVYKKPYFGQVIAGDDITLENSGSSINTFFVKFTWNSTPILPLTDIQGYHIGYQFVREYQSNGAFTDFVFQTRSLDAALGNSLLPYPIAPLQYFYDNGRMKRQTQGGNDGTNDFVVAQQGFQIGLLSETINQNQSVRVEAQSGDAGTLFLTNRFQWQHSGFYQAARDTSIIDGVRTITTYDYSSFPRKHLQPNQTSMTNSDGEVTVNKIRYPHEIVEDGDLPNQAVYQEMIDRNMIGIPIEQTREVDGTLVSGSRNQFNLFFDDPYLEEVHQYETTWDTLGNEVITGWELIGTINEYYSFGRKKKETINHWPSMEYEYHPVHRLPTKKSYLDFEWNYTYHPGSRLISRITQIDGQYIDHKWDGLARIDSIISRLGAIKVDFDYKYAGQDPNRPQTYVKQQTTYMPSTRSELQTQTFFQYFDDIARPFQTVRQAYSNENGFDVISATEFDAYNRPFKAYEDFEIASTGGFSVAVPNGTPFTLNTYENTPLNRLQSSTPPNWHNTTMNYGQNTVADGVMNWQTGMTYAAGLLTKEIIIDPNNHKTILFKDKRNRPVLTRKEGDNVAEKTDTYSLYDAKERPTIVIPPAATLTTTPNLIFKTFYDGANNPIFKKIPDMDLLEMRYNNRDLPIAQQEGNLRMDGKWMITQYDDYGRNIKTGLNTTPTTVNEVWTTTFWDGQIDLGSFTGFSPLQAPKDLPRDLQELLNAENANVSPTDNSNTPIYKGKIHYTETAILDGNTAGTRLFSINRYDSYGRVDRQQTDNHLGGFDNMLLSYDFLDNQTRVIRFHALKDAATDFVTDDKINIDHQGRKIKHNHLITGIGVFSNDICELIYDAKDLLKTKKLGGNGSGGFLQEINYTYLPNQFLSGINTTMATDDLFQLNINYDQEIAALSGVGQKNGNITSLQWQVKGGQQQTYGFHYDYLDRLTAANYNTPNNDYGTTYGYDKRGNFTHITRRGMYNDGNDFEPQQIDNMIFMPIVGTNKIKTIADTAPCPDNKVVTNTLDNTEIHAVAAVLQANNTVNENATITYQAGEEVILQPGFHAKAGTDFVAKIADCPTSGFETAGFVQRSTNEYLYDNNGNQTSDPNKGITTEYNYLNLPYKVNFNNGNVIEWLYLANGTKVQKAVKRDGLTILKQDYISSIEYQNDTLEAIYVEDGRLFFEDEVPRYEFQIADHLGNARVLFSDKNGNGAIEDAEISEISSFYPFGLRHKGAGLRVNESCDYLFNGKELDTDFGLNWYHYGVRQMIQ